MTTKPISYIKDFGHPRGKFSRNIICAVIKENGIFKLLLDILYNIFNYIYIINYLFNIMLLKLL